MKVLLYGLLLFFLSLLLHLVVWRRHLPTRGIKVLLQIFFATLFIGTFILWITSASFLVILHTCLFFTSLALAYTITYSAVEADSPTILMVKKVAEFGSLGIEEKRLQEIMNDDLLIKPRIKDLLLDKMIYLSGDKYKLTLRGFLFVLIFIFYRKLLNLPKGG